MIKLVSKDKCTGCGACSYICPKGCIEMKENDMHELLPVINAYMCVWSVGNVLRYVLF